MTDNKPALNRLTQSYLASSEQQKNSTLDYDRDRCAVGHVHLGLGAFHRAHQAVYTDQVLAQDGGNWRIIGVSLRSAAVKNQLNPQNGLYTLAEMDTCGTSHKIIGAISHVLVAPENPQAVLDALSAESCRIISLSITEKGYCYDPATGQLNKQHPEIVHDLSNGQQPKTAIGFIAQAIHNRWQQKMTPPTILSCDNLPNNGSLLKQLVLEFVAEKDPQLSAWIQENVPFPNTMVDRIVPATLEEDITTLAATCGYEDLAMVKAEKFSQWVIEDNFAAGRPDWDKAGAQFVKDVKPYEVAKLRLLNASHSSLAYLGYLAGYEFVHQVVGNGDFKAYLSQLMLDEICPTLQAPEGLDLNTYCDNLLQRFANPSLNHKISQIAMDGSQKLPLRHLVTLRKRLDSQLNIDCLCLTIAGWMRYALGFDEKGNKIAIQDPLAKQFASIAQEAFDPQERLYAIDKLVNGFLDLSEIFGEDLIDNSRFKNCLTLWLGNILANGVATTLKIFLTR